MNCRDVTVLLVAYLDGEVTPSERRLIQVHLAGCASCQREQRATAATRERLSESLKMRAAWAAPSPQAWSRLQASLADEAQRPPDRLLGWLTLSAPDARRPHPTTQGVTIVKRRLALAALAVVLVTVAMGASIPAVRAQVQQGWTLVSVSGRAQFTSYVSPPSPIADFVPGVGTVVESGTGVVVATTGSDQSGAMLDGVPKALDGVPKGLDGLPATQDGVTEAIYQNGDQFRVVTVSKADGNSALPEGEKVSVNGRPAMLVKGFSGEYRQSLSNLDGAVGPNGRPATLPTPVVIKYTNANQLSWIADGLRYEVLSNLPVDELLRVAADLPTPR